MILWWMRHPLTRIRVYCSSQSIPICNTQIFASECEANFSIGIAKFRNRNINGSAIRMILLIKPHPYLNVICNYIRLDFKTYKIMNNYSFLYSFVFHSIFYYMYLFISTSIDTTHSIEMNLVKRKKINRVLTEAFKIYKKKKL